MKIAILELSIGSFGKIGFYNSQEIGLAKALIKDGNKITIYKCVSSNNKKDDIFINEDLIVHLLPSKKIGSNALINMNEVDINIDVLFLPGDIQISVPRVYDWCKKNRIRFVPYVGTIQSQSKSIIKKLLMNISIANALRVYKKTGVIAKTNFVKKQLNDKGINDVLVMPVCLDESLLNEGYRLEDVNALKREYGYSIENNILLLIGRIENDRSPLDCIPILSKLYHKDSNTRMLIVGKGSLEKELKKQLQDNGLYSITKFIPQIENIRIWEIYRISNKMLSFNRNEIFGMSIMEAMYYELPVFALNAPGPNDIINNNKTGFLFSNVNEMKNSIDKVNVEKIGINAHNEIINKYKWEKSIKVLYEFISK